MLSKRRLEVFEWELCWEWRILGTAGGPLSGRDRPANQVIWAALSQPSGPSGSLARAHQGHCLTGWSLMLRHAAASSQKSDLVSDSITRRLRCSWSYMGWKHWKVVCLFVFRVCSLWWADDDDELNLWWLWSRSLDCDFELQLSKEEFFIFFAAYSWTKYNAHFILLGARFTSERNSLAFFVIISWLYRYLHYKNYMLHHIF